MSALYGTLNGDGRAAPKTRCAHRIVSASAQSHEGSVTVTIQRDTNGSTFASIEVRSDSGVGGRTVMPLIPLSMLIRCKALKVAA